MNDSFVKEGTGCDVVFFILVIAVSASLLFTNWVVQIVQRLDRLIKVTLILREIEIWQSL